MSAETKLTTAIHVDAETLDLLERYARRHGVKLATAIARAVGSGARRLATLRRYRESPRGRRVRRLQQERRDQRRRTAREEARSRR